MKQLRFQWLQTVPYEQAAELQLQTAELVRSSDHGIVLGLEHPLVVTLGRRMQGTHLNLPLEVPVIPTQRGGLATLHNLGQLVIYPVIPLSKWNIGVREYVEILLKTTQLFLLKCNIIVDAKNNGLHTENGKIASLGINVKKGIATHGIALNINNDLNVFSLIEPCGIQNQSMDKVENYMDLSLEKAFELWCTEFEAQIAPQKWAKPQLTLTSIGVRP